MRAVLFPVFAAACFVGQFASAQEIPTESASTKPRSSVSERLVGAWRLISVETKRGNGEVIYPFYGKHPQGLLIYDPSGWMSVQIVSDPNPAVPAASSREGFLKATPSRKRKGNRPLLWVLRNVVARPVWFDCHSPYPPIPISR